jgi:hypothetical protein
MIHVTSDERKRTGSHMNDWELASSEDFNTYIPVLRVACLKDWAGLLKQDLHIV